MKVYELMEKLSHLDAGAEVLAKGSGEESESLEVMSAFMTEYGRVTLFAGGFTLWR